MKKLIVLLAVSWMMVSYASSEIPSCAEVKKARDAHRPLYYNVNGTGVVRLVKRCAR